MHKGARHRQLLILGMLLHEPMYGHQIKETIDLHMESFSDLKRANLYYLLDQLAEKAFLERRLEPQADPQRSEREVYYITPAGRAYFQVLLRETLTTFEGLHNPVDVGIFFLPNLPRADALALLDERRAKVQEGFDRVAAHRAASPHVSDIHDITTDHLISQYELELGWLSRARERIERAPIFRTVPVERRGPADHARDSQA